MFIHVVDAEDDGQTADDATGIAEEPSQENDGIDEIIDEEQEFFSETEEEESGADDPEAAEESDILESGSCGSDITYVLYSDFTLVLEGTGDMYDYNTDAHLCGNYASVQTVIISEGISSIGSFAFYDFSSLYSIRLPETLLSIGNGAFSFCSHLTEIRIPESVTSITASEASESPFYGCDDELVIYVDAYAGNTDWDPYWNYYDDGYELLVIYRQEQTDSETEDDGFEEDPDAEIEFIDNGTAEPLGSGVLEEGYCGENALYTLFDDFTLIISGSGDMYDYAAGTPLCGNAAKIKKVVISEGITSIGANAFTGCSGIADLRIPDSIRSIGKNAFKSCLGLRKVYVPGSIESIEGSAAADSPFFGCSNYMNLYTGIGEDSGSWASFWNYNTGQHQIKTYYGYTRDDYSFWAFYDKTAKDVVIPYGVTMIPDEAYMGSTKLQYVSIPETVRSIGDYAFNECKNLITMNLPSNLEYLGEYAFWHCYSLTGSIIIPSGITQIRTKTFSNCEKIESVVIPASVTRIEFYAFEDCYSLNTVIFSEGSQLSYIGEKAFRQCTPLRSIFIPEGVERIEARSFDFSPFHSDSNLTIYVEASQPKNWDAYWSYGCKSVVFGVSYEEYVSMYPDTTYSIRFESNGATSGHMGNMNSLVYGTNYYLLKNAYEKNGYLFDGWNTMINGQGTAYSDRQKISLNADSGIEELYLYAQWKREQYRINYSLDGGQNNSGNPATYDIDTDRDLLDPVKQGYDFLGWYTDPYYQNRIVRINEGSSGELTLYAKWQPHAYVIEYISAVPMTDNPNPGTYTLLNSVTLKNPTAEGYIFGGWFKEGSSTKVTSISRGSTGDIALYANWTPIKYNIVYNANGGSGSMTMSSSIEYDSAFTLKKSLFTRKGFEFTGWNTANNGSGTSYEDEEEVMNLLNKAGNVTLYAQWDIITYTLTLNPDRGTPAAAQRYDSRLFENEDGTYSGVYNVESPVFRLPTLVREGYIFGGWFREGVSTKVTSINMGSTGDIYLYAKWTPIKYNIVYNANGGSGSMTTSSGIEYDSTFTLSKNLFTRKGYEFAGWNTRADGMGTSYVDEEEVMNVFNKSGNVSLFAQWNIITYQLSLNPNLGVLFGSQLYDPRLSQNLNGTYSGTYNVESPVFRLPTLTREGYIFGGWFKEGSTARVYYVSKGSTGDIDLYAKWTPIKYNIVYNANGGTGRMTMSSGIEYDSTFTLLKNLFTRKGYEYAGWNTANNGSGTSYEDEEEVMNLKNKAGNLTLYAKWNIITYAISADPRGGLPSGTQKYDPRLFENEDGTYSGTYNVTSTAIKLPVLLKEGYVFGGWIKEGSGTRVTSIIKGSTGDVDLYAKWTPIKYSIVYSANGGTGRMTTSSGIEYDSTFTLSKNLFTRKGYEFAGWNTKANGTGTSYEDEEEVMNLKNKAGNITLYAQWTPVTYSITYDSNGADIEADNPLSYNITTPSITLKNPTRYGYTFNGWFKEGATVKTSYISKGSTGDIRLQAKWTIIKYTIKYHLNYGTNPSGSPTFYYISSETFDLPIPTRKGYTFDGWYLSYNTKTKVY
ncbi:MAG: InlB B-repeat-containing protein, partial [Erysipelotrichaceae bacterium]|nr:InlB B-repeat-containing protein [Erysipelotrichaceae bacterium]